MKKASCTGFSLLELMIAITVIGILASLAIPSYQDYAVRAKIGEALNMISAAKLSVSEYYVSHGSLPSDMDQAGIESVKTQYIDAMDYQLKDEKGDITIVLSEKAGSEVKGKKITFQGVVESNFLRWRCQPASENGVAYKFLPASCRPSS